MTSIVMLYSLNASSLLSLYLTFVKVFHRKNWRHIDKLNNLRTSLYIACLSTSLASKVIQNCVSCNEEGVTRSQEKSPLPIVGDATSWHAKSLDSIFRSNREDQVFESGLVNELPKHFMLICKRYLGDCIPCRKAIKIGSWQG